MTNEANTARDNISALLGAGRTFESIARAINSRKSLVKGFYDCSGRDLDTKQCETLAGMAGGLET